MSTFLGVLQVAFICYIFLISLTMAKGKLKFILVAMDVVLLVILLLFYLIIANVLSLSFSVSCFIIFILTIAYFIAVVYMINRYKVLPETHKKGIEPSRVKPIKDRANHRYDDDDDYDTDNSYVDSDSQIDDTLFQRGNQEKRKGKANVGKSFSSPKNSKSKKSSAKSDGYKDFNYGLSAQLPENDMFDFGASNDETDFSSLDTVFEKESKNKLDEFKSRVDNKHVDIKNDDTERAFDFGGSSFEFGELGGIDDSEDVDDSVLSEFLYDFGSSAGNEGMDEIDEIVSKATQKSFGDSDTASNLPLEEFLADNSISLSDVSDLMDTGFNFDLDLDLDADAQSFDLGADEDAQSFDLDLDFDTDAQRFDFDLDFDAAVQVNDEIDDEPSAKAESESELSLEEMVDGFSLLKSTLAKIDDKFMTSDMDLEYVLIENINAQNIRVKVIDDNTVYINKFASEIALANAQRLLSENNQTDAKKLLAQLCCSSTDSTISNEAYISLNEIMFGKDSELEIDDLINAMIDKEEKLVELAREISDKHN